MYFAFVIFMLWSFYLKPFKFIELKVFLIATIYSVLIEICQGTICINRSFDLYDIIANTIGAGFGVLITFYFLKSNYLFSVKQLK
jgi:VanZ family protein